MAKAVPSYRTKLIYQLVVSPDAQELGEMVSEALDDAWHVEGSGYSNGPEFCQPMVKSVKA